MNGIWRIPDTKNGDPLNVVLIQPAIEILERRQEEAKSDWVFSRAKKKLGKNIKKVRFKRFENARP